MVDLSRNRFSGQIPKCINNITFGQPGLYNTIYDDVFSVWGSNDAEKGVVTYGNILFQVYDMTTTKQVNLFLVGMDFVTKKKVNSYKGNMVNYMSGLDLSCNSLGGEIPSELGEVEWIHALNLSHNQIIGQIPTSISGLRQLESLDLSYNNLSGSLPLGLVELTFLECFSVAYNNLSGSVPNVKDQFGTFEKNSYEGNPYLCGGQTEKNCSSMKNIDGDDDDDDDDRMVETTSEEWYEEVDMSAFWAAYIIFFLGVFISSWRCLEFNENGWTLIWSHNDKFFSTRGPQPGMEKIEKRKSKS
ncbi:unnamed protein product [Cuscuta campestris]|uniref:Uncharacterized protein n=1 Tax=Cuscuta campestris TaxID=132261 RepID=A0A484KSR7_9ASTE|nr:unnamed protein product [Cuscuta campestris]